MYKDVKLVKVLLEFDIGIYFLFFLRKGSDCDNMILEDEIVKII